MDISRQASPASLKYISAGYCQTALVDKSEMIRTYMGTHNISAMVTLYGTPCAIPPRKM
jgi:hypothetical protein